MDESNEKIELEEIPEVNIVIEELFDDYGKLNDDIRKQLPFSEYLKLTFQNLLNLQLFESGENGEVEKNKISQKDLCKLCKKEEKSYMDKDFCIACISKKTEEAKRRKEEIERELETDCTLNGNYGKETKIAYIVKKYGEEEKENKFLYLKTLAKKIVNLRDLN
jgi:hypothetical protein